MKKQFAVAIVAILLLSVLTAMPVMSGLDDKSNSALTDDRGQTPPLYYSNNTEINSNILCSTALSDFKLSYSSGNPGDDNTCDKNDEWNDNGTNRGIYSCESCVIPTDDLYINADTTLCSGFYNIPDAGATGVIIINADNVVLDCSGATINGVGSGRGIYNPGFKNVVTKNCNVRNYQYGIFLSYYSNDNQLINNTVTSNSGSGFYLQTSSGVKMMENTANSNRQGINLYNSSNNKLIRNTANSNDCGFYLGGGTYSSGNKLNWNTACDNKKYDFYVIGDFGSGDDNTCDKPHGWNDDGTTGCTYPCIIGKSDLVITEIECDRKNDRIGYKIENIGEGAAPACHYTGLWIDDEELCEDHVDVDLEPGQSYQGWFECYTWAECQTIDVKVCADIAGFVPDQVNDVETGKSSGCGTPPMGLGSLFQSFTPSALLLTAVDLRLRAGGGFPVEGYDTTVKIRSGTFDGALLATATAFVPGPQTPGTQLVVNFKLSSPIEMTPGETYVIEWISPQEGGVVLTWMIAEDDPYSGGTAFGCSGIAIPDEDFIFTTYVTGRPDLVDESDEGNNCLEKKCQCIPVKKPDLVIKDVKLSKEGDHCYVDYLISNTGTASAPASTTYLYVLVATETYTKVASDSTGALASGASRWDRFTYRTTGAHKFKVCADGPKAISESNETNNCRTEWLTCTEVKKQDLAYIYSTDTTSANSYKSLLDANGYSTTLIQMSDVATTDFSKYDAIIAGSDTGSMSSWGDSASVSAVKDSYKPIIGLGEGGYALFGQLKLSTGHPNGWHGDENSIYVVDTSHTIFKTPNAIPIPKSRVIRLYTSTQHVGIYLQEIPSNIVVLGREVGSTTHYPLTLERNKYLLWGFTASPKSMTRVSRGLFINVVSDMTD